MKIVLFSHPSFSVSQSMPRFVQMIEAGMRARGHQVEVWTATPRFHRIPLKRLKKWLGYLDQFLLFPVEAWWRSLRLPKDTLFVFADQALGPWVTLASRRPHVIHCHDFLALRASLGEFIPDTSASWTGRLYQSYIKAGFVKGRNFISVSRNTQRELHRFIEREPELSEVVFNGLNFPYRRLDQIEAKREIADLSAPLSDEGFILHVGGNQWYKNRAAVLEIYEELAVGMDRPPALWLVGLPPPESLRERARKLKRGKAFFISGLTNSQVQACYSVARALIFPSLEEGFGWPIVEAMACGCPVLTTDAAPMTEIGGAAAIYVPRVRAHDRPAITHAAAALAGLICEGSAQAEIRRTLAMRQSARFSTEAAISQYERVYRAVLDSHKQGSLLRSIK